MKRVLQAFGHELRPMVVPAGHPVLRARAALVKPEELGSPEIKALVGRMVTTMRKGNGCGLAAPQIGVGLQLICYEVTEKMLHGEGQWRDLHALGMEHVPLRVLANPRVAPLGPHTCVHREGCLSVPGFSAHVARALAVQVDAHDVTLNMPVSFRATGWTARILQHEMDHLDGKLYIDGMLPRTFTMDEERVKHRPSEEDVKFDHVKCTHK